MDKRVPILKEVYALHTQLLDVYHQSAEDKVLLGNFCKKFVELVEAINPARSTKQFEHLFKPVTSLTQKQELAAHLLAASKYAAELTERITADPTIAIVNEIVALIFDYAELLRGTALAYNLPVITFAGSRNTKVDAYTSFKIATQFFWHPKTIQRSNTLNGFTLFALRPALESGAKELMGLKAICKTVGKPDHHTTQLPWNFLVEHKNKSYFKFPFNPTELQVIYKWTNHFVHTGTDAKCYVTALAIRTVEQLFQRMEISHWQGHSAWVYANIITDRAAMRNNFTEFLGALRPPRYPEWRPDSPLAYVTG